MKAIPLLLLILSAPLAWADGPRQPSEAPDSVNGNLAVPSVAALKAADVSHSVTGRREYVAGYYAVGDGGGGDFIYDSSSTVQEDSGTVIQPHLGSGRWLRAYAGAVNARWFGAKGDNTANDAPALQAAINSCVTTGRSLYIPAGHYLCRGTNLTINGPIKIFGDGATSLIDGHGHMTGSPAGDIGQVFAVSSTFSKQTFHATGKISAQANSLTLDAVSGLAVGDTIFLELGTAPSDPTLPNRTLFSIITAITGNVVTFADPIPEDILGTNRKVQKVLGFARDVSIRDLGLDLMGFSLAKARQVQLSDLHVRSAVRLFGISDVTGCSIDRVFADEVHGVMGVDFPKLSYGWVFAGWNNYGLHISNVAFPKVTDVNFFDQEGDSRDISIENADLGVGYAHSTTNALIVLQDANHGTDRANLPFLARNFHVNALSPGRFHFHGWLVRDLYLMGGTDAEPADFSLLMRGQQGVFRVNGAAFEERREFSFVIRPLANKKQQFFSIPSPGIVTHCRIRASTVTGITGIQAACHSARADFPGALVANRFVEFDGMTAYAVGGCAYYAAQGKPESLVVSTDSSLPADAYLVVEGETLLPTHQNVAAADVKESGPTWSKPSAY